MRVVVVGGGNIGRYLSTDLIDRGHEVLLCDREQRVIDRLARYAPQLSTLRGDGCAPPVLARAGAGQADVLVAATGDDEDNLVVSVLAKEQFGVPRVLARVNHATNDWLFDEAWGVDLAVSPPHLLTALVEEEVSAGDVVRLFSLERGAADLIEVRLDERSVAVGERIEDLGLPGDVTLVAILREGHVVTCRPSTPLSEGDEVLALVAPGREAELAERLIGRPGA
ncbi:MAG: TrkA family potassium uptake protein [Egibacteraceae bacterium]